MQAITGKTRKSMRIYGRLPRKTYRKTLTCSSAASPAKTSAWRGRAWDWLGSVRAYGGTLNALPVSLDHASLSWRMWQQLLPMDGAEVKLLRRLPRWGMTQNGALYELPMSERLTSENGGFVWPTPTASDYPNRQGTENAYLTKNGIWRQCNGQHSALRLPENVALWQTPRVNDAKKGDHHTPQKRNGLPSQVFPTPNARDWKGDSGKNRHSPALPNLIEETKSGKYLNPQWVEVLMGYPQGWTDID